MKIEELKTKGLEKKFKIVVPAAEFEKDIDTKVNKLAKTAKLPGFRAGKVPTNLIKQKYEQQAKAEALETLVQKTADDIVKDKKMRPVGMPDVKVVTFEAGKDVEFEISFENIPEIKVAKLSDVKLEKLVAEVPASEVEKALSYLTEARKETQKLEENRQSQKGDTLVIDFTGSVDGVEFKGGKGKDYYLELGSNTFIPGFEDQLLGHNAGDKVDVKVKFPKDYHAKDLADKDALFACEVKEIRVAKAVELNDEFAKSVGAKDLADLKKLVSEKIEADYNAASRMKLKRQLLDVLDAAYDFELPQSLTDAEYNAIVKQYEAAKKANRLDEEDKGKSEKDLLAEYKNIAARRVKLGLLLSEIGKDAKISVEPEDINAAIANEARRYPGQEKMVFDFYLKNKQAIENLKAPIFEEKIVDYIIKNATVAEKKVSVEELYATDDAPAKKDAKAKAKK